MPCWAGGGGRGGTSTTASFRGGWGRGVEGAGHGGVVEGADEVVVSGGEGGVWHSWARNNGVGILFTWELAAAS